MCKLILFLRREVWSHQQLTADPLTGKYIARHSRYVQYIFFLRFEAEKGAAFPLNLTAFFFVSEAFERLWFEDCEGQRNIGPPPLPVFVVGVVSMTTWLPDVSVSCLSPTFLDRHTDPSSEPRAATHSLSLLSLKHTQRTEKHVVLNSLSLFIPL